MFQKIRKKYHAIQFKSCTSVQNLLKNELDRFGREKCLSEHLRRQRQLPENLLWDNALILHSSNLVEKKCKIRAQIRKKIGITDKSGRKFLLRAFAQIGKKTHPPFPIFLQIWKQRCLQMRSFNGFPTINSSLLILFVEGNAHCTVIVISDPSKRRVTVPKRINFRKGSKRSLTPPSSSENHISFFL